MDFSFLLIAAVCLAIGGIKRAFLWVVFGEFLVSVLFVAYRDALPFAAWFIAFAVMNCAFVGLVMWTGHRFAREYAATLLVSAVVSVIVSIGYVIGWKYPYDMRPFVMAGLCTYQLWLAANDAGVVRGTLSGAARGLFAARFGRGGRFGFGHSSGRLGHKG